jgi:hypothetical protein
VSTFDICTAGPGFKPLDGSKRVNYRFGLVLGADEFWQQDSYMREADWLAARALHGYGTVAGLRVEMPAAGPEGPEVIVHPGLAVNPRGQFLHVGTAQCAHLNSWLARIENRRRVVQLTQSPPVTGSPPPPAGPVQLYVVLRHEECETDPVPVPGGPCRTQADSVAASRVADRARLTFELRPPADPEERVTRQFGTLLQSFRVGGPGANATEAQVRTRVAALSPTAVDSGAGLRAATRADATTLFRAAIHEWITRVRVQHLTTEKNACRGPSNESGILIAMLTFSIAADWRVTGAVTVDESARPLLVHTRQLQEWVLATAL